MFFSRILHSLQGRFAKKKENSVLEADAERLFALRHHAFKLFLKSWNKFQETMTAVEYTLCCDHPFGMYRIHELCCSVATQVFQCIHHLERLDPKAIPNLTLRFNELQTLVSECIYPKAHRPLGPLTCPLGQGLLSEGYESALLDPATKRLEKLRKHFPDNVPQGFVITAAGAYHFFEQGDLLNELARRTQAVGGYAPLHLTKLSRGLGSLVESKDLPEDLACAVSEEIRSLRARVGAGGYRLLLRGRLWPLNAPDSAPNELRDPGIVVWGPSIPLDADESSICRAIIVTLARKFRAQALIYRRARGLRDSDAGFCVTCLAVEEPAIGGLAHTGSPLDPKGDRISLYGCAGLPQEMESSTLPVDTMVFSSDTFRVISREGEHGVLTEELGQRIARFAKQVELDRQWPLSLTFVCTKAGKLMILLARPLFIEEPVSYQHATTDAPCLFEGGLAASLGRVSGRALVAKTWDDVRRFPKGAILVVPDDKYMWVPVVDRAAGIIAETGGLGSRLASLAREFGKPALFGVRDATSKIQTDDILTVCVDQKKVYAGRASELLEGVPQPPDYMRGSPVWHTLKRAAEHILPLTMTVDSVDFRSKNCKTYHDIARFCHERAVSAMFSLGAAKKYAPTRIKQLYDQVPKQFWVVNLSNGFSKTPTGPLIDIADICSVPMVALWRGMNKYQWEGPPPVDGKGFLSVLFEATANPNLEPSAQTSYFSEKNYFLISHEYCSLHSRFGFHFVSVEATLGERNRENSIVFQLRGGAADIERRILRVRFVADILWEFGFESQVQNDALVARIEDLSVAEGVQFLAVAGYLTIHTRQLDMIMQDRVQVRQRHDAIVRDCKDLFTAPLA